MTVKIRIPLYAYDNTPSAFVADDSLTDPFENGAWVPGTALFPTIADEAGDAFYVGHADKFYKAWLNITAIGVGTYTLGWQYWNSSWTALSAVVATGTWDEDLKVATGLGNISYTFPADWLPTTVNGVLGFWIRAVQDGGTMTTEPVASIAKVGESFSPTKLELSAFVPNKTRIPIAWTDDSSTGAAGNSFRINHTQENSVRALEVTNNGFAMDEEHYSEIESHAKATMLRLFQASLAVVEFDGVARTEAQIVSTDGT